MQQVISPLDREALKAELTADKFLRKTNRGGNELYVITSVNSPAIMREIGRLREETFRLAGGGTGKELDIDHYDIAPIPYSQLIVWDPESEEIVGGYRFHVCNEKFVSKEGEILFATAELFDFNQDFIQNYLPYTIELGRSFVQPKFQATNKLGKGIFALDNLWDGLGALVVKNPEHKYFLGKVTMYKSFRTDARNMILYFLDKYFGDKENMIAPKKDLLLETGIDRAALDAYFTGGDYKEDYRLLVQGVRNCGENIPPLINSYMGLSPTMRTFGTAINRDFGKVEETGLMITIKDLYSDKVKRHIDSFIATEAGYEKIYRKPQ